MEIQKKIEGDKLTVELKGRLDAVTAIEFDKDIAKNLDGVKNLILDLANLEYIASAGLRILLKLQKKMNTQGDMKIEPSEKTDDETEDVPEDVGEGDSGGYVPKNVTSKNETPNEDTEEISVELSAEVTVPNFYGKSIRETARLANNVGLTLETSGSGYAVEQSIEAGEVVERGKVIKVTFSP